MWSRMLRCFIVALFPFPQWHITCFVFVFLFHILPIMILYWRKFYSATDCSSDLCFSDFIHDCSACKCNIFDIMRGRVSLWWMMHRGDVIGGWRSGLAMRLSAVGSLDTPPVCGDITNICRVFSWRRASQTEKRAWWACMFMSLSCLFLCLSLCVCFMSLHLCVPSTHVNNSRTFVHKCKHVWAHVSASSVCVSVQWK